MADAEVVSLGLDVQAPGLNETTKGLENLEKSGARAATVVDKLRDSFTGTNTASGKMAQSLQAMAKSMADADAQMQKFTGIVPKGVERQMGKLKESLLEVFDLIASRYKNLSRFGIEIKTLGTVSGYAEGNIRAMLRSMDSLKKPKGFDSVKKAAEEAQKEIARVEAATSKTGKELGQMESAASKTSGAMTTLKSVIQSVAAVMAALKIVDTVKKVIQAATKYEELTLVVQQVGLASGHTAQDVEKTVNAVRRMGLAGDEARQSITNLLQGQIELSKATDLARIAQNAAAASGASVSATYERLIQGITSAQSQTLRTMGLNVDFQSSYKNLAQELGKTADALNEAEKAQARVNSVMEVSTRIAGAHEASLQSLRGQMGDIKTAARDMFTDFGTNLLEQVNALFNGPAIQKLIEFFNRSDLLDIGIRKGFSREALEAIENLHELREALEASGVAAKDMDKAISDLAAQGRLIDAERARQQLSELDGMLKTGKVTVDNYSFAVRGVIDSLNDLSMVRLPQNLGEMGTVMSGFLPKLSLELDTTAEKINKAYKKTSEARAKALQEDLKQAEIWHNSAAKGDKTAAILKNAQKAYEDFLKSLNGGASKVKSATSQIDRLRESIAAISDELGHWDLPPLEREARKINAEFDKTVKSSEKIKNALERSLTVQEAELKKQRDLLKLEERRKQEQEQHLRDHLDFYKRLEELSGAYGLSIQFQNQLIDIQAEKWRDMELPLDDVEKMVELLKLEQSREGIDGVERSIRKFLSEATNQAKDYESTFGNMLSGLDSGFKSIWQGIFDQGKLTLDSFKNVFVSFISDLMHYAITRPVTIQIAASMSGALGLDTSSLGISNQLSAGNGGLLGNLLGDNPLGTANSLYNNISGLFGGGGIGSSAVSQLASSASFTSPSWGAGSAGAVLGGAGLSFGGSGFAAPAWGAGSAGSVLGGSGVNLAGYGASSAASAGLGALGAAGGGAAVGSLASPYVNNMLGIQNNKGAQIGSAVGGIGATAVLGALAAANIWNPGGWVMAGIAGLASIFGGSAGGLFGGSKPKRPAVRSDFILNLGDALAYEGLDVSEYYGRDDFRKMTNTGQYMIATRDRNKAGEDASSALHQVLEASAEAAIARAQEVQQLLPEAYAKQFQEELAKRPMEQFWDVKGAHNYSQEGLEKIAQGLVEYTDRTMHQAFAAMDFSEYTGKIDVDKSSLDGLARFTQALAVVDETLAAIEGLGEPTSEWVLQAEAALAQMKAWELAMQTTGVTADYAAQLMDDYRKATIDNFIDSIHEAIKPTSDLEKQIKAQIKEVDGWVAALEKLGATEEQVAEAESVRGVIQKQLLDSALGYINTLPEVQSAANEVNAAFDSLVASMRIAGGSIEDIAEMELARVQALQQKLDSYRVPFLDDLRVRAAAAGGIDTSDMQLAIQQRNELEQAAKTFGADSDEYSALQAVHVAEKLRQAADKAQAEYERLAAELDSLASAAASAAQAVEAARLALVRELVNAVENAKASVKSAIDAWVNGAQQAYDTAQQAYIRALETDISAHKQLAERLKAFRGDLWLDNSLVTEQAVYGSAKQEMDRLYTLGMSGDRDAAGKFLDVAKTFLQASQNTQGEYSGYQDDFYAVQGMLEKLEEESLRQLQEANKELELQQEQLTALGKGNKTLEELKKEMEDARAALERATAEQQAAYDRWGFEAVLPGLAGLEAAYYAQTEALLSAEAALNDALLQGITTQAEIDSIRIVNKLDELKVALSEAQAQQAQVSKDLAAAQAAAEKARLESEKRAREAAEAAKKAQDQANNVSKAGFAGSKYATEFELLQAKAAWMNANKQVREGYSSYWTPSSVLRAIMEDGMTTAEWYQRYGKLEGFASGGVVGRGGWAMVGEEGPEIAYLPTATKVLSAGDTSSVMDSLYRSLAMAPEAWADEPRSGGSSSGQAIPAGQGNADFTAMLAALQGQVALLQTQVRILSGLHSDLSFVRKHTKQTVDNLDTMVESTAAQMTQTEQAPLPKTNFPR